MGTLFLLLAICISRSIAESCSCKAPLTIGQFNVGQEPFQVFKEERLSSTIRFINDNTDFDVLCMQELWTPIEKQRTNEGISSKYPYSFTPSSKKGTCKSSCSGDEINSVVSCATHKKCQFTVNIFDFIGCLHRSCDHTFTELSDTCQECIIDPFYPKIQSKLTRCAGFEEKNGLLTSCTPLFNGTSDTILASKYPLIEKDFLQFEIAPEAAWSTVYGKIKHPTFGHVNVFCSHLVAGLSLVDFSRENFYESNELLEFVNKKVGNTSEIVVLTGDFNSSPFQENISSYFPQTYDNIIKHGFTDTTVKYFRDRKEEVPCTSCSSNPLSSSVSEEKKEKFSDHIFVKEKLKVCVSKSGPFATENIVQVVPTAYLNFSHVPLSDHYGIFTSLCPSIRSIGSSLEYTPIKTNESTHKAIWGGAGIALVVLAVFLETWIMRVASGAPTTPFSY